MKAKQRSGLMLLKYSCTKSPILTGSSGRLGAFSQSSGEDFSTLFGVNALCALDGSGEETILTPRVCTGLQLGPPCRESVALVNISAHRGWVLSS